jgi:predicted ATP-dependent endonuclease of OLD family
MPVTIDIELKNYRCFEDSAPAFVAVRPGFTALIGKNNSGKSTLLRFLYEFRNLFEVLADHNTLRNASQQNAWHAFQLPPTLTNPEPLFCDRNTRDLTIGLRFSNDDWVRSDLNPTLEIRVRRNSNQFLVALRNEGGVIDPTIDRSINADRLLIVGGSVVADTNNTSEAFRLLASTFYIGSFRNAINVGANDFFYDMPVGQAFIRTWKSMQAGHSKSQSEATYRLKHEIRNIFDFKELEIIPAADEKALQVNVDGKHYPLLEVGSGIAHFIMVLATASTKQPSYILIDEPELSLHASLQADFLQTLTAYSSQGVIFATHSLGLAATAIGHVCSPTKGLLG